MYQHHGISTQCLTMLHIDWQLNLSQLSHVESAFPCHSWLFHNLHQIVLNEWLHSRQQDHWQFWYILHLIYWESFIISYNCVPSSLVLFWCLELLLETLALVSYKSCWWYMQGKYPYFFNLFFYLSIMIHNNPQI